MIEPAEASYTHDRHNGTCKGWKKDGAFKTLNWAFNHFRSCSHFAEPGVPRDCQAMRRLTCKLRATVTYLRALKYDRLH